MSEIPAALKLHIAALIEQAEQERANLLGRIAKLKLRTKANRLYTWLFFAALVAMFVDRVFGLTATCLSH